MLARMAQRQPEDHGPGFIAIDMRFCGYQCGPEVHLSVSARD
jgi:hypothetical protein